MKLPIIALGTWSWGSGSAGGDQIFGNHLTESNLRPVFDEAMELGLNLWDTATVYGMGASEDILGDFIKDYPRKDVIISTKFTPQIAPDSENPVVSMCDESCCRLHTDYIDTYWIHNPADVERWTPMIIPLLQSGKIKMELEIVDIYECNGFNNFICSIANTYVSEDKLDENGMIDYNRMHTVLFEFPTYSYIMSGDIIGKCRKMHGNWQEKK